MCIFGVLLCVSVSMSVCVQPVTEIGMGRRVRLSVDTFYDSFIAMFFDSCSVNL